MKTIDWTGVGHLGVGVCLITGPLALMFQSPWPVIIGFFATFVIHWGVQHRYHLRD